MTVIIDAITQRKLALTKQLYQQALNQSQAMYNMTNRIMAVIGFDLTVETMMKIVVGVLDKKKLPADDFNSLVQQCENLLSKRNIPEIPQRVHIIHIHAIRNDAQHKAKYPNEVDLNDCRTYVRDFCREITQNVWGINFDEISQLDLITDELLRKLLDEAASQIEVGDYKRASTLAVTAFNSASYAIYNIVPIQPVPLLSFGLKEEFIQYLSNALESVSRTANYVSALLSTGINIVDYNRFRQLTPNLQNITTHTPTDNGYTSNKIIQVFWNDKTIDKESALWVHSFVVNSIINWQAVRLDPRITDTDGVIQQLIQWNDDVIVIST